MPHVNEPSVWHVSFTLSKFAAGWPTVQAFLHVGSAHAGAPVTAVTPEQNARSLLTQRLVDVQRAGGFVVNFSHRLPFQPETVFVHAIVDVHWPPASIELYVVGQPVGAPVEQPVHVPPVQLSHWPLQAESQQILVDAPVATQNCEMQSALTAHVVAPSGRPQ